ncbi:MAG: FtsL-like putative cell division protein [Bacteroidales bacterium]
MNEIKENIDNKSSKRDLFRSIIDGSMLSKELILKNIRFIMYLVFLGLVYIANRNDAERILRKTINLKKEIEELKAEHMSVSSTLMQISQQSEVEKLMRQYDLNLTNSDKPPFKITLSCQK